MFEESIRTLKLRHVNMETILCDRCLHYISNGYDQIINDRIFDSNGEFCRVCFNRNANSNHVRLIKLNLDSMMDDLSSDDQSSDMNQSDYFNNYDSVFSKRCETSISAEDLFHIDMKVRNQLEGNYGNEQNAVKALKIRLQSLEDFRDEAIRDLKLKINLTYRKIEQAQQSRFIEEEHTRFQFSRIKSQALTNRDYASPQTHSIEYPDIRDELKKTNRKIREIKELINKSVDSHNSRKAKLEAAFVEIKDQIKEFEEKETEAWQKSADIFRERDLLAEKLESKRYELQLAIERLARARSDLADLKDEVVELDD